jgi:hypothetical protein
LKDIEYTRHDFHHEPENRKTALRYFVLDVPYLLAFGVIPPLSIMNRTLKSGGGQGGMGPGATWKPFTLTDEEYAELVQHLVSLDLDEARQHARFIPDALRDDTSLHSCRNVGSWLRAAKMKYGV